MLDKVIHFIGGCVTTLALYLMLRYDYDYHTYMALPVIGTLLIGVGIEVFQMITGYGRFDIYDVAATFLGCWVLFGTGEF